MGAFPGGHTSPQSICAGVSCRQPHGRRVRGRPLAQDHGSCYLCICRHACTQTCMHTDVHAHRHVHRHVYTQACMHMDVHAQKHVHTSMHAHEHACTLGYTCTRSRMSTQGFGWPRSHGGSQDTRAELRVRSAWRATPAAWPQAWQGPVGAPPLLSNSSIFRPSPGTRQAEESSSTAGPSHQQGSITCRAFPQGEACPQVGAWGPCHHHHLVSGSSGRHSAPHMPSLRIP